MRLTRTLTVAGLGMLLVVTAVTAVHAAESPPSSTQSSSPEHPPAARSGPADVGPTLQLVSSRVSQSITGILANPRRVVLEPHAVNVECPGPSNCTLVAEQHVQMGGSTGSGNKWAVCTHIDGKAMTQPLCPYLGELPDGGYDSGSYLQTQSGITPGIHKMRTFVYVKRTATVDGYSLIYSVYSEG